jgi:serine/threonine protein kinase
MGNDPLIGLQLGAYHIQTLLGEGGMARVYKAFHDRLHREVAIKIILPEYVRKTDFQRRFEQEAQLVAKLQHRNIVAVYDFGESQNMVYLAMQYVGGGTLRDQLVAGQPLEPRRAALYAIQIARALHHAHQYGIVHRDVKPMNMLIATTNRNELLLSDFGLAKLFVHNPETPLTAQMFPNGEVSLAGDVTGTPRYMAPEQCLGQPVDARTDIYALGVVLFEMLSGQLPFQGETTLALLHQHAYTPAPSVLEVNPSVPEALVQITARALAKKPEERYQSAKEIGQTLESFLSQPVSVIPSQPVPQRGTKKRVLNYTISGLLLVLVAVTQILFSNGIIHWPILGSIGSTTNISTPYSAQTPNCTITSTATQARPFTETFQDKQRGWRENTGNDIVSTIERNAYSLNVGNRKDSLFFCPDSTHVGTLPSTFTLTTQIAQKQGGSNAFYGVAFHLSYDQTTNKVFAYAIVVNEQGTWAILKYSPLDPHSPITFTSGTSTSIHPAPAINTLQVIAQGSKYSFKINDTILAMNGSEQNGQADQLVIDQSYTGGLLALLVSGPHTSFLVTSVKLTMP